MSSIENQLAELNKNIVALTAAITAASGGKAAGGTASTGAASTSTAAKGENKAAAGKGKAKPEASPSNISKAQMQAALNEVKEALGTDAARAIITAHGFGKMADITEDKYEAVYEAAKAAIEPQAAPGADLEDDGL